MADVAPATTPVLFKKRPKVGAQQARRVATSANSASGPATASGPSGSGSGRKETKPESDIKYVMLLHAQRGLRTEQSTSSLEEIDRGDDHDGVPSKLADLIALRRLRASNRKEGIDLERLNAGSKDGKTKRKKRKPADQSEQAQYGLKSGAGATANDGDS